MRKKTAHIVKLFPTEKKRTIPLSFETEWHLESEMSVNIPYVSSVWLSSHKSKAIESNKLLRCNLFFFNFAITAYLSRSNNEFCWWMQFNRIFMNRLDSLIFGVFYSYRRSLGPCFFHIYFLMLFAFLMNFILFLNSNRTVDRHMHCFIMFIIIICTCAAITT